MSRFNTKSYLVNSSSGSGGPSSTNNNISTVSSQNSTSLSSEFERVKKKLQVKMDLVFETCLAQDTDFPIVDSPIWVFGRSYSIHYDLDELKRTVTTCMWMSYRKNFPSIGDTNLSSDRGWGCMIRAGQMVIAKALLLRHLGSDWHWQIHTRDPTYLKVVSLFADSRTAPLSLHQIAQSGASLGKSVGSWLGPNTVAQAFKKLLSSESLLLDLQVFISMDSSLVKSEVKKACLRTEIPLPFQPSGFVPSTYSFNSPRKDPKWKPLILVIPLRLGLSDLNASYVAGIKVAFESKQGIGIIGGRPNHALYFIGYAEDEVLFLDPHQTQPCATVGSKIYDTEKLADESYHIDKPGRMPFAAMDPSLAVCFYCESEESFDSMCTKLSERFHSLQLPLFEICDRRPVEWCNNDTEALSCSPPKSFTLASYKSLSPSTSFTSLGFPKIASRSRSSSSQGKGHSKSAGSSPRKSDGEDDEFEILG
jgi:cysteine protease ATG4